jgi:short-subunit dehydrogenase
MNLKPIKEQVMVITGASSGIGLVTARMAAKRGARVVLTARNADALERLAEEITADPSTDGTATFVAADVADESALRHVADVAASEFGRIDTWVNGAGVSLYGRLTDVSWDDQRRLFETNFWGVVAGSRVAVERMRHDGGALINIGSTSSDRAVPLQGMFSASKHALKAFTDALRMEVEHDELPLSVTLVKPHAVDTPIAEHAKNYLPNEPASLPPPVYAPEVVAETILHCAEHPVRDVFAGGGGKLVSVLANLAPRLTDKLMEKTVFTAQQHQRLEQGRQDNNLYGPTSALQERSGQASPVHESSLYTQASLHPFLTGAALAATGLTMASYVRRRRSGLATRLPKGQKGREYLAYPW